MKIYGFSNPLNTTNNKTTIRKNTTQPIENIQNVSMPSFGDSLGQYLKKMHLIETGTHAFSFEFQSLILKNASPGVVKDFEKVYTENQEFMNKLFKLFKNNRLNTELYKPYVNISEHFKALAIYHKQYPELVEKIAFNEDWTGDLSYFDKLIEKYNQDKDAVNNLLNLYGIDGNDNSLKNILANPKKLTKVLNMDNKSFQIIADNYLKKNLYKNKKNLYKNVNSIDFFDPYIELKQNNPMKLANVYAMFKTQVDLRSWVLGTQAYIKHGNYFREVINRTNTIDKLGLAGHIDDIIKNTEYCAQNSERFNIILEASPSYDGVNKRSASNIVQFIEETKDVDYNTFKEALELKINGIKIFRTTKDVKLYEEMKNKNCVEEFIKVLNMKDAEGKSDRFKPWAAAVLAPRLKAYPKLQDLLNLVLKSNNPEITEKYYAIGCCYGINGEATEYFSKVIDNLIAIHKKYPEKLEELLLEIDDHYYYLSEMYSYNSITEKLVEYAVKHPEKLEFIKNLRDMNGNTIFTDTTKGVDLMLKYSNFERMAKIFDFGNLHSDDYQKFLKLHAQDIDTVEELAKFLDNSKCTFPLCYDNFKALYDEYKINKAFITKLLTWETPENRYRFGTLMGRLTQTDLENIVKISQFQRKYKEIENTDYVSLLLEQKENGEYKYDLQGIVNILEDFAKSEK